MSPSCETRVSYAITVTFRPEFTFNDKFELIKKLPKLFKQMDDPKMVYSIEYHKHHIRHPLVGQDNPNAPHVHIHLSILDTKSRKQQIPILIENLTRNYGRPDVRVLHTATDIELWDNYILKDVAKNNLKFPTIEHLIKMELKK